jgi:Uncharacterised nucleotidyltransferase
MRRPGLSGDIWPDDIQELLLTAALLRGGRGSAAWSMVRPRIDLDYLPGELHRLMPLLSKGLTADGLDDPDLARLKGVYQFSWYRNTMLFNDAAEVLGELARAGIPTMLLRGAAIATAHRKDVGIRPMTDVDILVREVDLDRARLVAKRAGWLPLRSQQPLERRLAAAPVQNSSGRVIRIHWQPSPNLTMPGAAWDGVCERAEQLRFLDVDTTVPSRADHLVHTCVDGARANSGALLGWIVDAMALLSSSPGVLDWDAVVAEARRLRVTLIMSEGLRYLKDALDAEIPDTCLQALARTSTTTRDRLAHRLTFSTTARIPSAAEVAGRFTRLTADRRIAGVAAAAPEFLATLLDLERRRDVPAAALKKLARRTISPDPPLASLSKAGAGGTNQR